ncbi:MAG TPA: hypothetical protein VFJ46_00515 [Xanthobacteraceae bacterium]|nr:hypothetical protein [Xanthobacteraceae bacterium]
MNVLGVAREHVRVNAAMRANIGRCAAAIDQKHDVPQFGFSLAQRQIVPKPERMSQGRVLGVD